MSTGVKNDQAIASLSWHTNFVLIELRPSDPLGVYLQHIENIALIPGLATEDSAFKVKCKTPRKLHKILFLWLLFPDEKKVVCKGVADY